MPTQLFVATQLANELSDLYVSFTHRAPVSGAARSAAVMWAPTGSYVGEGHSVSLPAGHVVQGHELYLVEGIPSADTELLRVTHLPVSASPPIEVEVSRHDNLVGWCMAQPDLASWVCWLLGNWQSSHPTEQPWQEWWGSCYLRLEADQT